MNRTPGFVWDAARQAQLERLWAKGLSPRQIGAALGCSRKAVVGRIRRSHLPIPIRVQPADPRPLQLDMTGAAVTPPPRDPDPAPWRGGPVPGDLPPAKPPPADARPAAVARLAADARPATALPGVSFWKLKLRSCRFPVHGQPSDLSSFRFCGAPTAREGSSWCEAHERIAMVTPVRKLRK